jgi:ParB family transcriptional regulator, chromosome partitioning protein
MRKLEHIPFMATATKRARYSPITIGVPLYLPMARIQNSQLYERTNVNAENEELIKSISKQGLLQPIIVRPTDDSVDTSYSIVAGNRRYNACRALGWEVIQARVVSVDDKEAFQLSLTENIQRKSLNPIEEARAFETYSLNYGWGGITELATSLGKSISYVDRRMRLLDLAPDVIELVSLGKISPSAADELLPIHDIRQQSVLAHLVENNRLSTRRLRLLKRNIGSDPAVSEPLKLGQIDDITQRIFAKSIYIVRSALSQLDEVVSSAEGNWIVHELLMEHRRMLHNQIDILIKQKNKVS